MSEADELVRVAVHQIGEVIVIATGDKDDFVQSVAVHLGGPTVGLLLIAGRLCLWGRKAPCPSPFQVVGPGLLAQQLGAALSDLFRHLCPSVGASEPRTAGGKVGVEINNAQTLVGHETLSLR